MSETVANAGMADFEMMTLERETARLCHVWLNCYLEFPTADNFNGLTERMREYQASWMNGRVRIPPSPGN